MGNETILAIDPGNTESGYALITMPEFKILDKGKIKNEELLQKIDWVLKGSWINPPVLAIEMIASYGMAVGRDVFETCVWVGRFIERYKHAYQFFYNLQGKVDYVYRKDEKLILCGNPRAKDANIRQALIDRYAKHDFKNGKGTKKNPDVFYGVKADIWAAIAVGVTWYESKNGGIYQ